MLGETIGNVAISKMTGLTQNYVSVVIRSMRTQGEWSYDSFHSHHPETKVTLSELEAEAVREIRRVLSTLDEIPSRWQAIDEAKTK